MLIVSQSKNTVIMSPETITIGHKNVHGEASSLQIYASTNSGNFCELGTYKNESRCRDILFEIAMCHPSRSFYVMPDE